MTDGIIQQAFKKYLETREPYNVTYYNQAIAIELGILQEELIEKINQKRFAIAGITKEGYYFVNLHELIGDNKK